MQQGRARKAAIRYKLLSETPTTRVVFGAFWLMVFFGALLVNGSWAGYHAIALAGSGLLMAFCPPSVRLPRLWWLLALLFVAGGAACFLPMEWFPGQKWRAGLEQAGIETGARVVIQAPQAAEQLGMFAAMLVAGLWLAGHRPTPMQARIWALVFTLGVAVYAILSGIMQQHWIAATGDKNIIFGFFPNRNHTATYLAMGAICGLGCALQAQRDKNFWMLGLAALGAGVCMYAIGFQTISRAGVVLVAIGGLIWLPMLGRKYLGKHGLWAAGLATLLIIGMFVIVDSTAKTRITETFGQATMLAQPENLPGELSPSEATPGVIEIPEEIKIAAAPEVAAPKSMSKLYVDFRIPVALDTFKMIQASPWTGVGAGQYVYLFPQYRDLTIVAQGEDCYHPESSWLWMAAELGLPAAVCLLALVALAFRRSLQSLLAGRDRALRGACWVAALLVPIHGLFDVSGHRFPIAWSAVFLFTLSLRQPAANASGSGRPSVWPGRVLGFAMILGGLVLARAEWLGGPRPTLRASTESLAEARRLYDKDLAIQRAASAAGETYDPAPAEDLMERALGVLEKARQVTPLDKRIVRFQSVIALRYENKFDLVEQAFRMDRALDPTWVGGPLEQANALSGVDPERARDLWMESLERARAVERLDPDNRWAPEKVHEKIQHFAHNRPELQPWLPAKD